MEVQEVVSAVSACSLSESARVGEQAVRERDGREEAEVAQLDQSEDAGIVRAPEVPWPKGAQVPHGNKAVGVAAGGPGSALDGRLGEPGSEREETHPLKRYRAQREKQRTDTGALCPLRMYSGPGGARAPPRLLDEDEASEERESIGPSEGMAAPGRVDGMQQLQQVDLRLPME